MLYYVQNVRETKAPRKKSGWRPTASAWSAERKYTMASRNNPARFTVDFAEKKIIGTETSLNKAKRPGSAEYKELCKLMETHPQFDVVAKAIKRSTKKQTYKELSFTFIENYISIQHDADSIKSEYEHVKRIAASLGVSVYPYTKSWFLKKFSTKEKPFDMSDARQEINGTEPAANQAPAGM